MLCHYGFRPKTRPRKRTGFRSGHIKYEQAQAQADATAPFSWIKQTRQDQLVKLSKLLAHSPLEHMLRNEWAVLLNEGPKVKRVHNPTCSPSYFEK